MKLTIIGLFVIVSTIFVAADGDGETEYTSKFDNIDIDEILRSDRLLTNYFKCLMGKGRCTPEGVELKKVLPDALETGCSKCSETHRKIAKKVIQYFADHKKNLWEELLAKYDPKGIYRVKFEVEAKEIGIKV